MDLQLRGRTALVTGASMGIGRAIATSLAKEGVRLAVMAPLDEFFAEVEAGRRRLLLLALAFVVAALPIVWWIGSMLSRSMKVLALETERIQQFGQVRPSKRVRSVIREIDDLGRTVATMQTVVRTFASFVPKRLVEQLVATGYAVRFGGTRRDVTILFTDIEGFTPISEKADPERVMVQTAAANRPAVRLYERHGFRTTSREALPDGLVIVKLERRVSP